MSTVTGAPAGGSEHDRQGVGLARSRSCVVLPGRAGGYAWSMGADDPAGTVMVFAPVPQLTATIEQQTAGPELHMHPGG